MPTSVNERKVVKYYQLKYKDDEFVLGTINEFEENTEKAIWETHDCFLFRLLNRALQSGDIELTLLLSFFMNNLMDKINTTDFACVGELIVTVYRGENLASNELSLFKQRIGCLVSNNTFLWTVFDRHMALISSRAQEETLKSETVVFEIDITLKHNRQGFAAFLSEYGSYGDAKDLLIAPGTVFRIDNIKQMDDVWYLKMTLYDDDSKLDQLNDYFDVIFLQLCEILRRIPLGENRYSKRILDKCRFYYVNSPKEL
ncbi:unnamed protein product [Didymodactylos carnosus]|uniref:Uncharacterized protein n=1 Tax=Didymodactylos carnosus TaxID=1234261 RepID=A0A816CR71_9BILA|nr:unnamed protein product [Didymodactylos carnosus]CAF4521228.1 unnamed protein product [Didymodactylos carnosus]